VIPYLKHVRRLFPGQNSSGRNSPGERLSERNHVGLYPVTLASQEATRPADTALYLVKHEEYVPFRAEFRGGREVLGCLRSDAAFALDCFHEKCGRRVGVKRPVQRVDVVTNSQGW